MPRALLRPRVPTGGLEGRAQGELRRAALPSWDAITDATGPELLGLLNEYGRHVGLIAGAVLPRLVEALAKDKSYRTRKRWGATSGAGLSAEEKTRWLGAVL